MPPWYNYLLAYKYVLPCCLWLLLQHSKQCSQRHLAAALVSMHKPLGYCQDGLDMCLNQPQARMPPLRAPIPTKMVVSASLVSALVRCCSRRHRSTARRVCHMAARSQELMTT